MGAHSDIRYRQSLTDLTKAPPGTGIAACALTTVAHLVPPYTCLRNWKNLGPYLRFLDLRDLEQVQGYLSPVASWREYMQLCSRAYNSISGIVRWR